MFIKVETRVCPECGSTSEIMVDWYNHKLWTEGKMLVQDAFPHLTKSERETLMTGYHSKCWDIAIGYTDEQEEE